MKVAPQKISQINEKTLGIHWNDGHESQYDVVFLRGQCTCAACVDEWTHERQVGPNDVSQTVRPVGIESVGHYALHIAWSDCHASGIYTYEYLRGLCSCNLCKPNQK